jgi:serine/threonine-protein kinase
MSSWTKTPQSSSSEESLGREDAASVLPGETLGDKYRIEARLAEGGMGVVYRATHVELDCPVAIKLIRPEHIGNEDVVARLLAEARIAASLRSKHVNRVLDVGRTSEGAPYLVLEYLEGRDLGAELEERGKLPLGVAVDYVLQACEALAEAHAFGIVHRDLKPENLFLAEEADGGFTLKILDFGISKAPAARRGGRALTNPFEVVGSPTYMSPEQIRSGEVDARTDVWALGAVLHELCTGLVFFEEDSMALTFKRILDEANEPSPIDDSAEAERLQAVVLRCLARDPARRFQDVVELAAALGPLGSDPAQGARVAKVAAAARARAVGVQLHARFDTPLTPLALSTSHVERALAAGERPFSSRRGWKTWTAISAAALVLLGLGIRRFDASPLATTPAPTPRAAAPLAAVAHAEEASKDEPAPAASAVASARPTPTPTPLPPRTAPALVRSYAAPVLPQKSAEPEPVAAVAAPTDEPPPVAPRGDAKVDGAFDAWDPNTFGGRK